MVTFLMIPLTYSDYLLENTRDKFPHEVRYILFYYLYIRFNQNVAIFSIITDFIITKEIKTLGMNTMFDLIFVFKITLLMIYVWTSYCHWLVGGMY
jgi:hypothetical protein